MRRDVLEAAGPAFIKWGQWAATRHDLFPPDFCAILEHLHTQVSASDWSWGTSYNAWCNNKISPKTPRRRTLQSCSEVARFEVPIVGLCLDLSPPVPASARPGACTAPPM